MNLSNFYNKLNFFFYITPLLFLSSENQVLSQDSQTVKKIIIELEMIMEDYYLLLQKIEMKELN